MFLILILSWRWPLFVMEALYFSQCYIFHGEVACFPLVQRVKGLWGSPCQWIRKWSYFESWHQCMGRSRQNQVFNWGHFVIKTTYESTHRFILYTFELFDSYWTSYKHLSRFFPSFDLASWKLQKHNKSILFKVQEKTANLRVFGTRTITIVQTLLIRSHVLIRCVY